MTLLLLAVPCSEQELLRAELESACSARDRAECRGAELEEELRRLRAELQKARASVASEVSPPIFLN